MMFCGAGSFKDVDKEEDAGAGGKPAAATKAKAKKASSGCKAKGKQDNPYATRGLDKFSTVLSELESRREKILSRVGPDVDADHLMVRFVQSEAKGWVPIVVKLPSEEEQAADTKKRQSNKQVKSTSTSRSSTPTEPLSPKEDAANKPVVVPAVKATVPAKKKKAGSGERWSWSWGRMVRPCQYWPLALVLLLLSLVVFGRVFAICCTSIWWYLLPILTGEESQGAARLPAAKTRMSHKVAAVAPAPPPPSHGKKNSTGASHEVMSPRSHDAHRKKG
ncbi:hypothetical protein PR202_ga29363 [Eleusine coracana subsp. coracana]|uniref:ZCF37 n=1 Tax=Eleusine coracana subsp. coracana TaxID=191504 RepID=A0AAV5DLY5_ELECO|nr:hypothetical protein PR202_ga29363 [Eleusine coracana subsp. coracana]